MEIIISIDPQSLHLCHSKTSNRNLSPHPEWSGSVAEGISGHDLPVVEDALREGLAPGVGAQVGGEAERLVDRQVSLDHEHGGAGGLGLLEDVSSPPVEHAVDTSDSVLRALGKVRLNGAVSEVLVTDTALRGTRY